MDKKVNLLFTGGGSGGHSVVALTLIRFLRSKGISHISYIGSFSGIEKDLCKEEGIPYYSISTGKLRRYFSFQNLLDFFRFSLGLVQALWILGTKLRKVGIVFSTGGFVSVPSVIAGRVLGKKVYLHEQTTRVGLANKISSYFCHKVFVSFDDSKKFFPPQKTIVVGYPVRKELWSKKLDHKDFKGVDLENPHKKILFVTGGGNGALLINNLIDKYRDELLKKFIIIHQTGKKFFEDYKSLKIQGYIAVPFIGKEMPDILKSSDLIISRSGAGVVSEIIAIQKKAIFIPLKIAQKNEQFHNAQEALKYITGKVIEEDDLAEIDLMNEIEDLSIKSREVTKISRKRAEELIFEEIVPQNKGA